jgi:hypothetical protein
VKSDWSFASLSQKAITPFERRFCGTAAMQW